MGNLEKKCLSRCEIRFVCIGMCVCGCVCVVVGVGLGVWVEVGVGLINLVLFKSSALWLFGF